MMNIYGIVFGLGYLTGMAMTYGLMWFAKAMRGR